MIIVATLAGVGNVNSSSCRELELLLCLDLQKNTKQS